MCEKTRRKTSGGTKLKKRDLGQFNTTKKDYILEGFEGFVKGKSWIDPFAGNLDLLNWAEEHKASNIKGYDIDETKKGCEIRDTLFNPPNYKGKWVIANPPYLSMNKNKNKKLYERYKLDDYYKIAINTVCDENKGCEGGIFIVPLNFISSENSKTRKHFFKRYKIKHFKAFEERVFDDTDYTVCSFYYEKAKSRSEDILDITFMPSKTKNSFEISEKYGWIAGQEFYKWIDGISTDGIGRWTTDNYKGPVELKVSFNDFKEGSTSPKEKCSKEITDNIILIRSIDTGTNEGRIKLQDINELKVKCLVGLESSRNLASVKFDDPPSINEQKRVIKDVNSKLEKFRTDYNSIFLTAFRNSTAHYSRKRMGFDMLYKMIKKSLGRID